MKRSVKGGQPRPRFLCPDCGLPLSKGTTRSGRLLCANPECPVITVVHSKWRPIGKIIRITRAAKGKKDYES